ncbi:DUF969 domain-containing protein [Soehngenia longivitae]|jgi:uncharacterized membrane protein|uniref:DUF969 domain-containing protein n=1 Tax=Soehngenia longivitae TaxID=2562294 RepID=A0A4Z0D293_9FIRM|nr:DUF969 domain-containing protein [Soehngenia longivitae]TFZ39870.1 DUF969 domain-containing protein [Soehngenia longivitae]
MIKLLGVLIIVVGFALKLDTIAVVLTAGVVTGIVGGLSFNEILTILGKAFVENRYMTVFFVTLPIIGLLEGYGLKQRAAELIGKVKAATSGKILSIYMVIRTIAAALSLRIGGHVEFIRPLIYPMAEGADKNKYEDLPEEAVETIKGMSASVENYANFYGQNVFIAAGGVLLIVGTLGELGIEVTEKQVSNASIPIAIIAVILVAIQLRLHDRKINNIINKNK